MNETALMVLVAFVIERVSTCVLFLLAFHPWWKGYLLGVGRSNEAAGEAERRYKFAYFVLAGSIALLVVLLGPEMRVLKSLGQVVPAVVDIALTWLVLVAGADRIESLLKSQPMSGEKPKPAPVVVEGTLTLKEDRGRAAPAN